MYEKINLYEKNIENALDLDYQWTTNQLKTNCLLTWK